MVLCVSAFLTSYLTTWPKWYDREKLLVKLDLPYQWQTDLIRKRHVTLKKKKKKKAMHIRTPLVSTFIHSKILASNYVPSISPLSIPCSIPSRSTESQANSRTPPFPNLPTSLLQPLPEHPFRFSMCYCSPLQSLLTQPPECRSTTRVLGPISSCRWLPFKPPSKFFPRCRSPFQVFQRSHLGANYAI